MTSSPDKIALRLDGREVRNFLSYRADADLFVADDAFELTLARPETGIKPGTRCELWVNDRLELTGIVDAVERSYHKDARRLIVRGRDLMGLLTDSCIEDGLDVQGYSINALAEKLLAGVPFINRQSIVYGRENREAAVPAHRLTRIEPGQTVFEALKDYALARGLLFYALPDGTFVFGQPAAKEPAAFQFVSRLDGRGNNVLEATLTEDISGRHSPVIVIGQQQSGDDIFAEDRQRKGFGR